MPWWLLPLLFIGTTVLQVMLQPKPKAPPGMQPAWAGAFKVVTAEEGRAIPVLWGKVLQKGMILVWWGDYSSEAITVEAVKASWHNHSVHQTTGYKYRLGAHLVVGHGEIDSVDEVWFDDKPLPGAGIVVTSENNGIVLGSSMGYPEYDVLFSIPAGQYDSIATFCQAVENLFDPNGCRVVFGYTVLAGWCDTLWYCVTTGSDTRPGHTVLTLRPDKYDGPGLATELQRALNANEDTFSHDDRVDFRVTWVPQSWGTGIGRFEFRIRGGSNVTRFWVYSFSIRGDPQDLSYTIGRDTYPAEGWDSDDCVGDESIADYTRTTEYDTANDRFQMGFIAGGYFLKKADPRFTALGLLGLNKNVVRGYWWVGTFYPYPQGVASFVGLLGDYPVVWSGDGIYIFDRGEYFECVVSSPNLFGGDTGNGGVEGRIWVYKGTMTQPRDAYLLAKEKNPLPAYLGLCYAVARSFYMGNSPYIPSIALVVSRRPNPLSLASASINGDANPANMIYEMLTDTTWGLGIVTGLLDTTSFVACGNTLATEGLGLSMLLDGSGPASGLVEEVCRYIDGLLYVDPLAGQVVMRLARADYDPDDLPIFDESNLLDVKITRPSWPETRNTVRVRFTDRADHFSERVSSAQDPVNIQVRGGDIAADDVPLLGISSAANAASVAGRILKALSYPFASLELAANRQAWALRPGDVFKLTWPRLGITGMVCRFSGGSSGTLEEGKIRLTAVEDIFAVDWTAYTPIVPSEWADPSVPPSPSSARRLEEVWYALLETSDRGVAAMCVKGAGPMHGFEVWSDAGLGVDPTLTNTVLASTPYGTLQGALAVTDAGDIVLENAVDCDRLTPGAWGMHLMLVGDELVAWLTPVVNTDGTVTLSGCVRGVCDTAPKAHALGTPVFLVTDGYGLTALEPYLSELTAMKVYAAPFNAAGKVFYGQEPQQTITTTSRATRPYCPCALTINTEVYPATVANPVVVAWEHRDRLATWSYADAGLTAAVATGVLYRVKAYNSGGSVIEERTTTGKTVTLVQTTAVVAVRVYAEVISGGLLSHDYLLWEGAVT